MPDTVVTDGLNSYRAVARSVMPVTEHVREIHIAGNEAGKGSNNRMERMN